VCHGFKNIGTEEAIILNLPSEKYDYSSPDEHRVDPHTDDIPHDWTRRDG
jgi:dTDP-4-dehydrorhamnose 3,5-epimerase